MKGKTIADLGQALEQAFVPARATEFDGSVAIATADAPTQRLAYRIHTGAIASLTADAAVDFTIYFDSADLAEQILLDGANPIDAFMAGQFKADGYLMWVFAVLSMFRR